MMQLHAGVDALAPPSLIRTAVHKTPRLAARPQRIEPVRVLHECELRVRSNDGVNKGLVGGGFFSRVGDVDGDGSDGVSEDGCRATSQHVFDDYVFLRAAFFEVLCLADVVHHGGEVHGREVQMLWDSSSGVLRGVQLVRVFHHALDVLVVVGGVVALAVHVFEDELVDGSEEGTVVGWNAEFIHVEEKAVAGFGRIGVAAWKGGVFRQGGIVGSVAGGGPEGGEAVDEGGKS